tara:strand:- start:73 stop:462 length:390 start_codon:yes stop_codon:yes gene_type:complete
MNKYYVYAHYVDNKPVYIGKGSGRRHQEPREYNDHTSTILYKNLDEYTALELERWLINLIGIDKLRNKVTWNAVSGSRDIYSKPTNSNVLQMFERAANGDMNAIVFIKSKIPEIFKSVVKKQQLNIGKQ